MNNIPSEPKIYHITHVNNLPKILSTGRLYSDAERINRSLNCQLIGMSKIKMRRLKELEVTSHLDTMVGEYVPFYFCPRSIMLYLLYRGNHPDMTYSGGQEPILHLEVDLHTVVARAEAIGQKWAFTPSNAGAYYTLFFSSIAELDQINWRAVTDTNFRARDISEGKQAEFLVHQTVPWDLITRIGVKTPKMKYRVEKIIANGAHQPTVEVRSNWYY